MLFQTEWWSVEPVGRVPIGFFVEYCRIALHHIHKAYKPKVKEKDFIEEKLVPFPFQEAKKFGNKMALYARLQVIVVTFF